LLRTTQVYTNTKINHRVESRYLTECRVKSMSYFITYLKQALFHKYKAAAA